MRWVMVVVVLLGLSSAEAERLRAPNGEAREVPEDSVPAAVKEGFTRIPTVYLRFQDGTVGEYSEDQAAAAEAHYNSWRMSDEEVSDYKDGEFREVNASWRKDC